MDIATQMRSLIISFLLLLNASAISAEDSVLITNAVLISGQEPTPIENSWVRVNSGKITEVGSGAVDSMDKKIIDAEGRYLIPGLIDSHVHLYHATGLKRKYSGDFESLYEEYMVQQPRSFLYYGFTSVVELNADSSSNARFESAPVHPRLFHCGQGVILNNGFMSLEIPPGQLDESFPGYVVDHYRTGQSSADSRIVGHSPVDAIEHVLAEGGRCVKVYYEEALWWPGGAPEFELPTAEIVNDLVDVAHQHNLPVILHATTPDGHRFALDTGVDILAHGMWEWPGQPFDAPEPAADYQRIANDVAESDIWIQPTLSTIRNTGSLFDPSVLADPEWQHAAPESYLQYLRNDAQAQRADFLAMFKPLFPAGTTPETMPALHTGFQTRFKQLVIGMVEHGANFLFATDTAVGGFGWGMPPGLAGIWEMRAWAEAGMSPVDLFRAATVNNALALGLAEEVGTIEPGKQADMLILRDNPLESVDAYDSIELVIIGGDVIERSSLSANH